MKWLKRAYDSAGLTQFPVGPHLAKVQAKFGGSVVLCLDVSGSMGFDSRLAQAVDGCGQFVSEAIDAGYSVAGLLWNSGVAGHTELARTRGAADRLFAGARANGGNNIVPTLLHCERMLEGLNGDLVIAIFGDGDLGNADAAAREAARLAEKGIRVITCGLGDASAEQLGAISSNAATAHVATSDGIASAIAGMAAGLRRS